MHKKVKITVCRKKFTKFSKNITIDNHVQIGSVCHLTMTL